MMPIATSFASAPPLMLERFQFWWVNVVVTGPGIAAPVPVVAWEPDIQDRWELIGSDKEDQT